MKKYRNSALITALSIFTLIPLICSMASAEILEWVGPSTVAAPWETGGNWYSLDNGSYHTPTDLDTARLYNAMGLGFTDSNITISSATAICQKLQMKYLTTKLTILTGGKLTTTGSIEMYQGDSSELDIQAGATMDACTKSNIDTATFRLTNGSAANGTDTVNVWGTLNIISLIPAKGASDLEICNFAGSTGTGTVNIYGTGAVNVDTYTIGSYGIGRIYMSEGAVMTIAGNATEQVNTDIVAGRIAGVAVAVIANYNSGENKTYVTAGGSIPAPPEAPTSISYPDSNGTGHYSVNWASSSGAILYQLERSGNGGDTWSQVYSGMNPSYSEIVSDGSYRYRVRAANYGGLSGWTTGTSDCVVALGTPPVPPVSITYPATSNSGQYTISWALSSGATSYQLERSSNGGGSWNQIYSGGNLSYPENVNDGSYRYRIKAANTAGSSDWQTGAVDCVVFIPAVSAYFSGGSIAGWNFYDIATNISGGDSVGLDDLSVLAQHWLNDGCGSGNHWCGKADIDTGGDVDFGDYAHLANNWGAEAGKNVLLQTIYGTGQDSSGTTTANAYRVLQYLKGLAMAFKVPADTTLDKAIFKCFRGGYWQTGQILYIRLFNVTGRNYLSYSGHPTITRAEPGGSGNPPIFLYSMTVPDSVPSHTEPDAPSRQYADLVISFGSLPVTAGEYFITFDREDNLPPPASSVWGNFVRSGDAGEFANMGKYPDGRSLPKAATVTTSSATGNTYYYQLYDSSVETYDAFSYLFAFQITTIAGH